MESLKFKNYETVTCEHCGANAEIMNDGVIGKCVNCGYQWGDWKRYSNNYHASQSDNAILKPNFSAFLQSIEDTNVVITPIQKDDFYNAINIIICLEGSCESSEFETDFGAVDEKPSEIKSQFFRCEFDSIVFFARIDLWFYEDLPDSHKLKITLAESEAYLSKINSIEPILHAKLMDEADIKWDNKLSSIISQEMLTW